METFAEYSKPLNKFQKVKKYQEERDYAKNKEMFDLLEKQKQNLESLELQKRETDMEFRRIVNERYEAKKQIDETYKKAELAKTTTLKEYECTLTKYQKAKAEYEKKRNKELEDERILKEKNRLLKEKEEKEARENEEFIRKQKEEFEKKEEDEYRERVKSDVSPQEMFEGVKKFIDMLSRFDRSLIKEVIDQHFQDEMNKIIKDFYIVFEDIKPSDPLRSSILQLFKISLSQDLTPFEEVNHEKYLKKLEYEKKEEI